MSPGYPATLQASHPGNKHNGRHGIRSGRMLEPRARDVAERIMSEPHTVAIDQLGAIEIGRLEALIQAIDGELANAGIAARGERGTTWLIDLRLRASRRLAEWLDRYGATPKGRAEWAKDLAATETLADSITRRREEDVTAAGPLPTSADDRAALRVIASSNDPRVKPADRLRALELLLEAGGGTPAAGAALTAHVAALSDDDLDLEFEALVAAEVTHRAREAAGAGDQ